ncbi:wyosine base formation domain-containing protein, partial [Streptomyces sp. NRRL WC-3753]
MSDPLPVLDDLAAESNELDALVAELSDAAWKAATPAEGWAVAHQIAHLAWT